MRLRNLAASVALLLAAAPVLAQEEPVFDSYDAMRAELDSMMMAREIKDVMLRFGGPSDMTEQDLDSLEQRMRDLFPYDFRHVALIDRNDMENGFRHELYGYWTGLRYLYVLVFMHDRGSELVAINIKFNTEFYDLISEL